jgi:hypothetical protein
MQISFDPRSPSDILFVKKLLDTLTTDSDAQPVVADNTGSAARVASPVGCADGAASNVLPMDAAAIKSKKKKVEREVTLEQTIDEIPEAVVTIEEARKALNVLTTAKGMNEGMKMLDKYDAKRIGELNQKHYKDFVKDCINGAR